MDYLKPQLHHKVDAFWVSNNFKQFKKQFREVVGSNLSSCTSCLPSEIKRYNSLIKNDMSDKLEQEKEVVTDAKGTLKKDVKIYKLKEKYDGMKIQFLDKKAKKNVAKFLHVKTFSDTDLRHLLLAKQKAFKTEDEIKNHYLIPVK
jgi:hypothetical protein